MLCEMVVREEETQVSFIFDDVWAQAVKKTKHTLTLGRNTSFHSSLLLQSYDVNCDLMHFSQIAGIVSITDASGFGFKHLRAIGLEDGKNMVMPKNGV